jgi:hypothetical protein
MYVIRDTEHSEIQEESGHFRKLLVMIAVDYVIGGKESCIKKREAS